MEPYSPAFRRALKEAHPGLRDADIDRLEELTTRRGRLLPDLEARSIASLEMQIDGLLHEKMPNFERVAREQAAILHAEKALVRKQSDVIVKAKPR
jgi:hypothetical protein